MLFEESQERDDSPRQYGESLYNSLSRSNRPQVEAARRRLLGWLLDYPPDARAELEARLRASDDLEHQSAFFELILYQTFARLGLSVTIHRKDVAERNNPDFVIESAQGSSCVEATVTSGETKSARAAKNLINTVFDVINKKLHSPDYFIGVRLRGVPKTPPPARKIIAFLRMRLAEIDQSTIRRSFIAHDDLRGLPHWPFEHDGWSLQFFPIPKSGSKRGTASARPLSLFIPEAKMSTSRQSLQKSLERKAGKYGEQRMPFILAVNDVSGELEHDDVVDALFGSEAITVTQTPSGLLERSGRTPDGLWHDASGPRYTRVSAVLVFFSLSLGILAGWRLDFTSIHLPTGHMVVSLIDSIDSWFGTDVWSRFLVSLWLPSSKSAIVVSSEVEISVRLKSGTVSVANHARPPAKYRPVCISSVCTT